MVQLANKDECETAAAEASENAWQENSSEIVISGLRLVAPLVFHPDDQIRTQLLLVDLVLHGDVSPAAEQDSLEHSISYSAVAKLIRSYTNTLPAAESITLFRYVYELGSLVIKQFHASFTKAFHWLSIKASLPKYSLEAEQVGLEWKTDASGALQQGALWVDGLECMTTIGINDWERRTFQKLSISASLVLDSVLFTQVMQYPVSLLIASLARRVSEMQCLTVEAASEHIAQFLLHDYGIPRLHLHVQKLNAIPSATSASIRLVRSLDTRPVLPESRTTAYLALGSNMGDRLACIHRALSQLASCPMVSIVETSMMYESMPMYYLDQNLFLNCVCKIVTCLAPRELLAWTQTVEKGMGRTRSIDKGPRHIDIDILCYGSSVIQADSLAVPHPSMCEREFVLRPLADIAPCLVHPVYRIAVRDLLRLLLKRKIKNLALDLSPRELPYVGVWPVLAVRGKLIAWRNQQSPTRVMGILNVTPDSFSDGGHYNTSVEAAVQRAVQMIEEGADIIDIGGMSTRPKADEISVQEELDRVVPVIQGLRKLHPSIPISIDTWRSAVAREALNSGADIINDISGGRLDPPILALAAEKRVPIVLMHSKGCPKTMMSLTDSYEHAHSHLVVRDIALEMQHTVERAMEAGIARWNIIVDPGIGFAKKKNQNLALLKDIYRHEPFCTFPVLVGPSRKQFIKDCNAVPAPPTAPSPGLPHERIWGTAAATAAAVAGGASIIRVHDVREMKAVMTLADGIWKTAF